MSKKPPLQKVISTLAKLREAGRVFPRNRYQDSRPRASIQLVGIVFSGIMNLGLCQCTFARPVSYLGGISVMNENRSNQNELMTSYTFHRSASFGIHASSYRDRQSENQIDGAVAAPFLNALIGRWNGDGQQSNIYLGAGYGALWVRSEGDALTVKPAPLVVADVDSETRDLYASGHYECVQTSDKAARYAYSRLRFGFAPYLAAIGSLHTWVLLQGDFDHWRNEGDATPMLRFFFQNVLWEMGYSVKGRAQFNWSAEI